MKRDTVQDFEDILELLAAHRARYLIVGGLAFIFHAKPRYTKDMDLWIGPDKDNVERANRALAEFGSPELLDTANADQRPGRKPPRGRTTRCSAMCAPFAAPQASPYVSIRLRLASPRDAAHLTPPHAAQLAQGSRPGL